MHAFFRRLRILLRLDDPDADMREEMELHRAMRQEQLERSGLSPADAYAESRRALGNTTLAREEARRAWLASWVESLWQDGRYALRSLGGRPAFTMLALATLGMAIGLNTAVFDVYSALALRPWPGADADRLVTFYSLSRQDLRARAGGGPQGFSRAQMDFFAHNAKTIAGFFLMRSGGGDRTLGADDVPASWVSGEYFSVLGIEMAAGRGFTPEEDRNDSPSAVVVLSHGYWQRQFGGDPAIVGRPISFEDVPFTVVGVAPSSFTGTSMERVDVWMPLASARLLRPDDRWVANVASKPANCCLSMAGRLAPGVTREQALAELALLDRQFRQDRDPDAGRIRIAGTNGTGRAGAFPPIFTGVMLVLLLACANVGNLLVARASARRREIGVRLSLGASRARVVRQLLTESLVLALLAGGLGLLVASWLSSRLVAGLFGATSLTFRADAGVLGYSLALAFVSCIVCGLAPALHATRAGIATALKDAGTVTGRTPLRSILLSIQVAVSIVLLVCAGLLARALYDTSWRDFGFPVRDVAVVTVEAPPRGYDAARIRAVTRQIADAVQALPYTGRVVLTSTEPLGSGNIKGSFRVPGVDGEHGNAAYEISAGYFDLLEQKILAGRALTDADANRGVVVISEGMARRFWSTSDALGKRLLVDPASGGWNPPGELEIVGVASDVRLTKLEGEVDWTIYQPLSGRILPRILVRDPSTGVTDAVRAAIQRVDPRLLVRERTLADNVGTHLTATRTGALMASALGGLALLLATIGMLGVFSYWVQQRTREIGIRMALGARSSEVVRLVLGSSTRALAAGLAIGTIGAAVASRFIRSYLFGVNPVDPSTYAGVALLLCVAAAAATYWPARRATRVDPVAALRHE